LQEPLGRLVLVLLVLVLVLVLVLLGLHALSRAFSDVDDTTTTTQVSHF